MLSVNSYDLYNYIPQGQFNSIEAMIQLLQNQWSNDKGYGSNQKKYIKSRDDMLWLSFVNIFMQPTKQEIYVWMSEINDVPIDW